MQTLGLAREQTPTDGLLKRLFWPTIENAYDVDLLQRQGFWVCSVVAVISAAMLIGTGQVWIGILVGVVFLLAGTGVREGSIGAATIIFLCYLCDRIAAIEGGLLGLGGGSPVIGLFVLALLLANIRAMILTRQWRQAAGDPELHQPVERLTDSPLNQVVNVLPRGVWPKGQYIFYPLGTVLLLLSIAGMIMLPGIQRRRAAQIEHQLEQQRQLMLTSPSDR